MDVNTCFATTESYRLLALYSHLIPAIATFILGLFAYLRAPDKTKAIFFFSFTTALTAWLLADLVVWTANPYDVVATFWEPLDFIEIVAFLLLFGFIYIDHFKRVPVWLYSFLFLGALYPFVVTLVGNAVYEMNQPMCEMVGNESLARYKVYLEAMILAATFVSSLRSMFYAQEKMDRIRIAVVSMSAVLFMGIFAGTEYIATLTNVFEVNLYALFTLPLFILMLTLAITSYGTFRLGDSAVRVLFYVFLVLATTQFFYVGDMTEFLLAGMSFVVILSLGIMLYRSNEREIGFRHQLELANRQQESLLHFISHEVKGFLTEGQNAFAGIVEGDFGEPPAQMKDVAQVALGKMRGGVATVVDILDAANLKRGTMQYKSDTFDFRNAVVDVLSDLAPSARAKQLNIETNIENGDYSLTGDADKIKRHVIRNLVDNAIKYTPSGRVNVALVRTGGKLRFSVRDSGVGITPEDMKKLFTEGGHGKDSIRTNVNSTGYGLFVAKSVVDAHKGKIWAESEGQGKGSTFVVELPIPA